MFRWHDAHAGFARCNSSCSRTVEGLSFGALASSCGTTAGGGSGGVLRKFDITYFPRMMGDVRFAAEVSDKKLPCPSRPRRFGSVSCTRRNREPYTPLMP